MASWFRSGRGNDNSTASSASSSRNPVQVKVEVDDADSLHEHQSGSGMANKATESMARRCAPPRNPPFKIRIDKMVDEQGKKIGTYKVIVFKKRKCGALCASLIGITRHPTFYSTNPEIRLQVLLHYLDSLKLQQHEPTGQVQIMIDFLEYEFYDEIREIETMIANDEITFHALWFLLKKDSKFVHSSGERLLGSTVKSASYDMSTFGGSFTVEAEFITTNGRAFVTEQRTHAINHFEGLRKISSLKLRPMKSEEMDVLLQRGRIFKEIAIGCHYRMYTGNMVFNHGFSVERFRATGRVMIDPLNFARFNPNNVAPNLQPSRNVYLTDEDDQTTSREIPEDKMFCVLPTITGFSFSVKRWGEIHLNGVSDIVFDSQAFSQLVMDKQRKAIIKSLVENSNQVFTDIISGKGGGCIFLLHGPPGTGKTLTAEAIADLLKKPLYSVTVGELGTTPDTLETKLRQILELAHMWNAVLLIDEADIFLERRSTGELHRNALVSVYLRLLEYFQGVLFLTSNRVKCFDEAFHSRVSIALRYESLNRKARRQVFETLLQASGVDPGTIDTKKIAKHELNGRQIKSTIRLAQTLAFSEGVPMRLSHLERTVAIASQFQDDLASLPAQDNSGVTTYGPPSSGMAQDVSEND